MDVIAVTVRREELEIEREPASRFDPPRRDAGEPAEALVMVLHEERPVVGLEVVPIEVVRVRRAVVRGGDRKFTDTVRRELIDIEGA
jgi:stress response protein YsnF